MNARVPFSVLMSLYFKESPEFLKEALASLTRQTRPASQVVMVLDGPVGENLETVLESFKDLLPITLVRLPENRGLAKALNAGLPHCLEAWVARFDTDDICEPDRFERQWAFLEAHPETDILGGPILEFDESPEAPYALRQVPRSHEEIVKFAKRRNPFNHMTVTFRKAVVAQAGGYPDEHLYEDYALWVRLIQAGCRCANLDLPPVRARAGRTMANRRGGWKYLRSEWRVQSRFRREGFISRPELLLNMLIRGAVRLAPGFLRAWTYSALIRKRTEK